ncbi:MAG: hypothetical protein V5A39_07365 [Haloarculaceae archaeon]
MTEEIDLDELDVEQDDEPQPNPGDWFWRGGGDPTEEPEFEGPGTSGEDEEGGEDGSPGRVPHVPRENKDKPVGIPVEGGGAGATSAADGADEPPDHSDSGTDAEASGPHGGGIDDMTMAITYEAMKQLEDPRLVMGDAKAWADWVGIVGDIEAFVINKFQRDHQIDVDFFNGSGEGPAERLAGVDRKSMFYAERMVLVGLPDEEWMAEAADWEFVPLSEAAEKADWNWADEGAG